MMSESSLLKYCFVILVTLTSSISSEDAVASCGKGYFWLPVGIRYLSV